MTNSFAPVRISSHLTYAKSTIAAVVWSIAAATSLEAQSVRYPGQTSPHAPIVVSDSTPEAHSAWLQLVGELEGQAADLEGAKAQSGDARMHARGSALEKANRARDFHVRFGGSKEAVEARKLECVYLVYAAEEDAAVGSRMEDAVAGYRRDTSIPAFDRAVVAGTYEFSAARTRIRNLGDARREHIAIAKSLIREFPDQPQGYVSLITLAMSGEDAEARELLSAVATAPSAPSDLQSRAATWISRLELVGSPITRVIGEPHGARGHEGWTRGRPGVVYFWSKSSPASIELAETLREFESNTSNLVGVCMDESTEAGISSVESSAMPGRQLMNRERGGTELLDRSSAAHEPLVLLVDASGHICDVRGLYDLAGKLRRLGL